MRMCITCVCLICAPYTCALYVQDRQLKLLNLSMCVPYTYALYVRLVCAGPTIEAAELDSKQFRAARGKEEDRETLSLR